MSRFDSAAVATRMTAGERLLGDQFPRNLGETGQLALPFSVLTVPSLTTRNVQNVLFGITGRSSEKIANRRLRGCLVAHRGRGLIFLDEDAPEAMRFAAAHEIAHFVGHYLTRRDLAVGRLGPSILEVLDGKRDATPAERIGGILAGCRLGVFTDVMDRDGGRPTSATTELMEHQADEAAFLALAPIGTVITRVIASAGELSHPAIIECLIKEFGLTTVDADRYGPHVLSATARGRPSFVDGLRIAASTNRAERHRSA